MYCLVRLFSFLSLIHRLERSMHASFIVSRRCKVTRCWYVGDPCWRSSLGASGGPYPVATCLALWRHGVGTFGTTATWPGMHATTEGVVSVFRYYSDVPHHTWSCSWRGVFVLVVCVTELTNYTKLSRKSSTGADDLANLSLYNPVVREILRDFKPTHIPAKIVISSAVTIINYIKVHITDTSKFKHSYYKPSSNKSSGRI
jgi:hypothetical protein